MWRVVGFFAVPDVVVTVLAYMHVISAMGWLGGGILFVSVIAPSLRRMSPAVSLEFMAKAVPMATRYFLMFATSTIVFGPLLLLTITPPDSPYIYAGVATALAAYIDVLITVRNFHKASRMAKEMLASGRAGPPPAEFMKAVRYGGIGTVTIVILLVVTLMFMIFSGYPF